MQMLLGVLLWIVCSLRLYVLIDKDMSYVNTARCPFLDCELNIEFFSKLEAQIPIQSEAALNDKSCLNTDPSTTDNVDEAHASLSYLKEWFEEVMPYCKVPDTEQNLPPSFHYDILYPSNFSKVQKNNRDLKYSPKLEEVVTKVENQWSTQAAKDFKKISNVFPKRTPFYRSVHSSLEGVPSFTDLEKDLSKQFVLNSALLIQFSYDELAFMMDFCRNVREYLSFSMYSGTGIQLMTRQRGFVPES